MNICETCGASHILSEEMREISSCGLCGIEICDNCRPDSDKYYIKGILDCPSEGFMWLFSDLEAGDLCKSCQEKMNEKIKEIYKDLKIWIKDEKLKNNVPLPEDYEEEDENC